MSLRKLRIGRFVFRVTRLNTLLLAISLSPRRSPVSPVDFISCTKRYIYTKWNTVDTAHQSNRSAILTVQHPEHISCPILLPLSCIVPHYIVALGTRFLVLQCCYCPSNLAAITIISAHDLSRYPLKSKRLCEREVSRLSLLGKIRSQSNAPDGHNAMNVTILGPGRQGNEILHCPSFRYLLAAWMAF